VEVVVHQPKIAGLRQAGEAEEAGGERGFFAAINLTKLTCQTTRERCTDFFHKSNMSPVPLSGYCLLSHSAFRLHNPS